MKNDFKPDRGPPFQSSRRLGRRRLPGPGGRAEQEAVLHVGGLWSRECRHLDSHPYEHGRFRPDQQQAYQGGAPALDQPHVGVQNSHRLDSQHGRASYDRKVIVRGKRSVKLLGLWVRTLRARTATVPMRGSRNRGAAGNTEAGSVFGAGPVQTHAAFIIRCVAPSSFRE